ncbi:MAG TPA: methyltransferase [Alphaproteobacteria bacterium]|nr:methyltransferase [Alphaproteobacteria bacterium]
MNGKKIYGDYQTPLDFSDKVCQFLKDDKKLAPAVVVEPTCGKGAFLKSASFFKPQKKYGIEINKEYCDFCNEYIADGTCEIINHDFFQFNLNELDLNGNVLFLGNPPWITNSELSALNAGNIPKKYNFKNLSGFDAVTGKSNFDICEYIILKLIDSCLNKNAAIAMLCKTSVSRNIYKEMYRKHLACSSFDVYEFDAKKIFGISVSACLLYIRFVTEKKCLPPYNIYSFDEPKQLLKSFICAGSDFRNTPCEGDNDFNGKSQFQWRQGVKHDCAKVMELTKINEHFINGLGEDVFVEDALVYPLVKSSAFKKPIINEFSKYVLVTQKKIGENTDFIKSTYPKTWRYLESYEEKFANRKSLIYKNSPKFAMFGIGEYSYSKYKVGLSGFYKKPLFSVLYSEDKKPVMTDDTSYFISFKDFNDAYVAMLILNSEKVQTFLGNEIFPDAKRPYTKKMLDKLDFYKIKLNLSFDDIVETEKKLKLSPYITKEMLCSFYNLEEFNTLF